VIKIDGLKPQIKDFDVENEDEEEEEEI